MGGGGCWKLVSGPPTKQEATEHNMGPRSQEVHGPWANFTAIGSYEQPEVLWVPGLLKSFKSGL